MALLAIWVFQDSDSRKQSLDISVGQNFRTAKLSIETLTDELNAAKLEKVSCSISEILYFLRFWHLPKVEITKGSAPAAIFFEKVVMFGSGQTDRMIKTHAKISKTSFS